MHRWSKLFIPTLREAPADAEVASHKFLLRAGYIRQLSAGVYSYLFLGQRSLNKIIKITREEMDRIGQEFLLPALHPRDLWEESGRWEIMGQSLFRLQDRKGAWIALGMTHEEVMTSIARNELRSYKQLPQIWYQIQTKFRDEPRPRSGLLRVRQFIMKDSYSFDIDEAGLDESYRKHDEAYRAIFSRCGLDFLAVEADSGAMGGSQSQEFMVLSDAGEDLVASCPKCGYAANMQKAASKIPPVEDLPATGDGSPELVHTPGQRTIEEVGSFLKIAPVYQIKAMAYMAVVPSTLAGGPDHDQPVAIVLRGDHTLNEAKLANLLPGAKEIRPMQAGEIEGVFRAPAGYLGPVGLNILPASVTEGAGWLAKAAAEADGARVIVILDRALEGRVHLVAGANQSEYHLRNVTPERDFSPTLVADVRDVQEGEGCPRCSNPSGSPLKVAMAVEIGHIFKLGYRYSASMGARVLDANGKEVMPIMGCYGIGMERILTSAIEQNHDSNGFWMPRSIAPFDIVVTVTNSADPFLTAMGEQVARQLEEAGFDVLLDDRNERAGVKFKDADLVGIPYRVNVGRKAAEGWLELVTRSTAASQDVEISQVAKLLEEVPQLA
jgi:prolyl-tRNA synthetase